ncbi:meiotic recombination protein SPO11 isoform X3 [Oryzias melastigma]|uniref:meiotic recombination protein SPO11 isoform X3 n=1 Tax=Oryzias melastigma TaxID=30732 RepID=UPI00168D1103|nr:meiotic recombination protein SPO11 isoform X3 [Oryzias melastigma]
MGARREVTTGGILGKKKEKKTSRVMESYGTQFFSQIDKLRDQLLISIDGVTDRECVEEELSPREILTRIESVILGIVDSLSKNEAPVLLLPNRSSWSNVDFDSGMGLQMSSEHSVTNVRSNCPSSVTRFAQILKILSVIYRLVQGNSYATKRDVYYNNTQLFGSQRSVDIIVDDISCMLKVSRRALHVLATSKGLIAGDLCYLEEDGTRIDCRSSSAGKGVPDVNSRLMVKKLWDTLQIPIFALVDADPHGFEIMCIYKYGSVAMSFEAHSLTVPSVMWLGLLPSDLQRLRVPKSSLLPLARTDESKLSSLLKRPYLASHPEWQKELELMQQSKVKAEIQSLADISPDFLTSIYLPNKLRYGGWL